MQEIKITNIVSIESMYEIQTRLLYINKPKGLKIEIIYLEELIQSDFYKHVGYYCPNASGEDLPGINKKGYKIVASFNDCKNSEILINLSFFAEKNKSHYAKDIFEFLDYYEEENST